MILTLFHPTPFFPRHTQAREEQARRDEDRKRAILVLAQRFMIDTGLLESARSLERESGVSLAKTDAADNVDLRGVLQEWEEVYESKFGRKPKMVRKAGEDGHGASVAHAAAIPGKAGASSGKDRRAARIAAEREALRAAELARRAQEEAGSAGASSSPPVSPAAPSPPAVSIATPRAPPPRS